MSSELFLKMNQGRHGCNVYKILEVSLGYPWDGEGCLLVTQGVSLRHLGVSLGYEKYKKKINEDKNGIASHLRKEDFRKEVWDKMKEEGHVI